MKQTTLFFANNPQWIEQFDITSLLSKLFDLYDPSGIYIVDKAQRVLYWSSGMEKLSGIRRVDMLGLPCLPGYAITDSGDNTEQPVNIAQTDDNKIEVQKTVCVLHDKAGAFAGGIGLLTAHAAESGLAPKTSRESNQNFQGILSRSPAMQAVFQIIRNAAETEATVLVRGESGSGKELAAKAIHNLSARRDAPFLAINCAALSSNLLDSELFGHVRGAFTGAIKEHRGLFQRAQGGTLFLDEVAELPLDLQAKLLRVIQERNFIPVGGDRSIDVDVRIVAATHRSLREEVKYGRFREDLMYRLRVVPIFIPPLRERREDIGLLLWHFIHLHNAGNFRKIEKIDPHAGFARLCLARQYPGVT